MSMVYDVFESEIVEIFKDLTKDAKKLGFIFDFTDVIWDAGRSWSLYIPGKIINVPVAQFGAYRNYNGGGVRGPIQNNGRAQEDTVALGILFERALLKLEKLYNKGYEEADPWDLPTGVLM